MQASRSSQSALLIDLTAQSAEVASSVDSEPSFERMFGRGAPKGTIIGPGDAIEVTLVEAPPAVLINSVVGATSPSIGANTGQRALTFPSLAVDSMGFVEVPFAGKIASLGLTPDELSKRIVTRLAGRANQPQAIVNISKAMSSTVTIVGEVQKSTSLPLTFKGERILDAIAAAGGAREPVDKVSVSLSRQGQITELPMDKLIASPSENIYLEPGDIVTVNFQTSSFVALGAAGRNEEIRFEANGITLAQALGRMGGLRDERANPRGVFIFRLEKSSAFKSGLAQSPSSASSLTVPVIYQLNLRDPSSIFASQKFRMHDKDVVYVTNSGAADLQKFVNIISSAFYPIAMVKSAGL